MKPVIRPIQRTDTIACADIVGDNWAPTVALRFHAEIMEAFRPNGHIYYVAEDRGKIVGFAGMMASHLMYGIWDFIWINVHADYQGRGIGKMLTEHRIREVLKRDGRAIHVVTLHPAFFQHFGFSVAKDYGDWKLMTAHLGQLGI